MAPARTWPPETLLRAQGVRVAFFDVDGVFTDGGGNLSAEPMFAAPERGDYRLRLESPLVDAGIEQPWMAGGTDLAGNPRVKMGGVDMGCYETPPPGGTAIMLR